MLLLDFLRNSQTEQMTQKWGERLEKMSIKDKLDALWTIATNIGHCEQSGELKPLSITQAEYGCLMDDTADSEAFLTLLEQCNPSIDDLVAVIACLGGQMHQGSYKEAKSK